MTEKAIILAGGMGTRMQKKDPGGEQLDEEAARLADKGLKGLIPVRGRPFLDYVIGSLLESGLRDLCMVIPPENRELQDYIREVEDRSGASISWAVQKEPLGTADALMSARDFAGADPFVMCNCDNLYPREALFRLSAISDDVSYAVAFDRDALLENSNFGEERVRRFAAMVADEEGRLEEIAEKPKEPERYMRQGKLWVSMNLYRFTADIFAACEQIDPDPERGELELTAAVLLLARKQEVRILYSSGAVIDMTRRGDIGSAAEVLAERSANF